MNCMNAFRKVLYLFVVLACAQVAWALPAVTIVWPGNVGRGTLSLTVTTSTQTYTKNVPYGEYSTAASLASAFGAHISQSTDWPVWAKGYPNGWVQMKVRSAGTIITNIQVCVIPAGNSTCQAQPSGVSVSGNSGAVHPYGVTLDGALYGYQIAQADGSSGYDAAGNITAYKDTVNQSWTLGYDSLNRLTSASQYYFTAPFATPGAPGGGVQQFFCWKYDSFGNRQRQVASSTQFSNYGTCDPPGNDSTDMSATYSAGNNRLTSATGLTGIAYDAAGNLTEDGNNSYLYNEDGQLCAVWKHVVGLVTGYLYNAEGQRVAKGSLNSFSCDYSSNGFSMTNEYIPGPNGEALTEVVWSGSQATWHHTNVSAGGQLAATLDPNGTHYQLTDWLGTRRMQLTSGTAPPEQTCVNQPFGDGQTCTGTEIVKQRFTGKERDSESGLDYFGARYLGSSLGRFSSPDFSEGADAVPFADFSNPQSLNLYAYVGNNPITGLDPDGHVKCPDGSDADVCVTTRSDDSIGTIMFTFFSSKAQQGAELANSAAQHAYQFLTAPRDRGCMNAATAIGATTGAGLGMDAGAGLGGGAGLIVSIPTAGTASIATVPGGAFVGGAAGAGLGAGGGAIIGRGIGFAMCASGGGTGSSARGTGSEARLTRPQQRQTAEHLGMREVKSLTSQGQPVFTKNGRLFTFSNTKHLEGEVFKELDRNGVRFATTDINLNRIGN